jgi:hypothetical protein
MKKSLLSFSWYCQDCFLTSAPTEKYPLDSAVSPAGRKKERNIKIHI